MAGKEQVRPLALAMADRMSSDEEYATQQQQQHHNPSSEKLHKRRLILCCGCCMAMVLLLAIVILVLALTLFRVKDPEMTLNSVAIDGVNLSLPSLALNMTIKADVSVKNPNVATFKFPRSTTAISYDGTVIGEVQIPAGKASARRTMQMNLTIDVFFDKILGDPNLTNDLMSGNVMVNSYTKLSGRVNLLNVFKRHAVVVMDCNITTSVRDRSVLSQECKRSVKL